ncbi:MAG: hypothetical protein K2O89_04875 [Clostridia bacterium]|nr:hypothetical protein [Clostridia bacterium]
MKIFRDKQGRSLLSIVLDKNTKELFILTDENGIEYNFEKLWYKPYKGITYCVLRGQKVGEANDEISDYIFSFEKIGHELLLRYEENEKNCKTVISDFYASNSSYYNHKFNNLNHIYALQEQQNLSNGSGNNIYYEASPVPANPSSQTLKIKKATMIVLIISYVLLLCFGILFVAVQSLQSVISGLGICEDISARAYAVTIGMMWIALTPSIGYYFATISPFEISKKVRIVIAVITTLLLLALSAVFYVIIYTFEIDFILKDYYEGSDAWFIPLSMAFGALGIMVCYALTLIRINPDYIKDLNTKQKQKGLFYGILRLFMLLLSLVLKLVKVILKFKEKHVNIFITISTILLTWLIFFTAFIFAIICLAVFIGAIILCFAKLVHWSYIPPTENKKIVINDGGMKLELTQYPYLVGEGSNQEVYKDYVGNIWYSDNGGKTVYRK